MWQRKCGPAERRKDGRCSHDVYHAGVSEGARPTAQGKDPEAAESLHLLEGYDHQEIAQVLGITEVASRTHLMRGKKQLQELLKEQQYVEGY